MYNYYAISEYCSNTHQSKQSREQRLVLNEIATKTIKNSKWYQISMMFEQSNNTGRLLKS